MLQLVSLVSALLWDLQLYFYYVNGVETGHVNPWRIAEGSMPWDDVQKWLQHPSPPEGVAVVGMIAGAAITGALSLLRPRFVGFPWG